VTPPDGPPRPRVAIIDYGIGNLPSARKAFEAAGADAFITRDPREVHAADGVVLPGVGAMGRCMESLEEHGMRSPVFDAIGSGRPFIGICVGMQMLHTGSDEDGGVEGLGVFSGRVVALPDRVKRPQMQWNIVRTRMDIGGGGAGGATPGSDSAQIMQNVDGGWFYFVHSYAPEVHRDVVGVCEYGVEVSAVVSRGNVSGTQFHPEKSSATGIALLKNFVAMCATSRLVV
jgi:imidazole glycerol-phosphate synthase subunit HisH